MRAKLFTVHDRSNRYLGTWVLEVFKLLPAVDDCHSHLGVVPRDDAKGVLLVEGVHFVLLPILRVCVGLFKTEPPPSESNMTSMSHITLRCSLPVS